MEISGQLLNNMQSKSVVMKRNARGREDSLVGKNSFFTKKMKTWVQVPAPHKWPEQLCGPGEERQRSEDH